MYKTGQEELVICPYNCYHVVSKLRIQKHIMKCKKNNPDVKLTTCFYNYSHRLKPEDMLAHYEICSHKTRVDGARYCEPPKCPFSAASVEVELPENNFPDIAAKTQFFRDRSLFLSGLNQDFEEDSQKLETSDSESEDESSGLKSLENSVFKAEFSSESKYYNKPGDIEDISEEENDLEPLPLPKTISKAFVFQNQQSIKSPTLTPVKSKPFGRGKHLLVSSPTKSIKSPTLMPSKSKPFGRGKNLLVFSASTESRPTDHLLPDLSDMDKDLKLQKPRNTSKFFLKNFCNSGSESIVSSMIDDTATLKSEEIIFDDDYNYDNGFILKNFDKYTKL